MKIALMGKFDGQPWRDEYLIERALAQLGHEVEAIPVTTPRLGRAADLTLVRQGYGLPPTLIDAMRTASGRPVVLWHAELLGHTWPITDPVAQGKAAQLAQNIAAYDLVCHHSHDALPIIDRLGAKRSAWVLAVGVDPMVHRLLLHVPKAIDVAVYGWESPRRRQWISDVLACLPGGLRVAWPAAGRDGVYGERLVEYLNASRVVLNVHYSESRNVESRLFEALGCGVPVVSEPISMPELFPAGLAVRYGEHPEALAAEIQHVLHDDQVSYMALCQAGYHWVHERYRYAQLCQHLLDVIAKELG